MHAGPLLAGLARADDPVSDRRIEIGIAPGSSRRNSPEGIEQARLQTMQPSLLGHHSSGKIRARRMRSRRRDRRPSGRRPPMCVRLPSVLSRRESIPMGLEERIPAQRLLVDILRRVGILRHAQVPFSDPRGPIDSDDLEAKI